MAPEQLAQELRRIASAIEASKRPSRELVAKAIKDVIAGLEPAEAPRPSIAAEAARLRETIASLQSTLEVLESVPEA